MASAPAIQQVERNFLNQEEYRRFTKRNVFRWLAAVAMEWSIIGVAIWVANLWPHWWVWVPAIVVIGTRQHGLGILAHEGVHFLVLRNRFWNDALSNLLCSYSIFYPVQGYRSMHLLHHHLLDTPEDPERATVDLYPKEWTFPLTRKYAYWLLVRDITGIYVKPFLDLASYIWRMPSGAWKHAIGVVLFHLVAIAAAIHFGFFWSYVLLWIVPLLTVTLLIFRIRTAAEHSSLRKPETRYVLPKVDTLHATRSVAACPIVRFFLAPHNMSYHVEHHLYPVVPVFRLKALHETLMKNPVFATRVHVTEGYTRLFDELTYEGASPIKAV